MKSAPESRRIVDCPQSPAVCAPAPTNPALDDVMSAYEQQSRLLEAAFSSARCLGTLQVAVRSELLDAIDDSCTARTASGMGFPSVNRC